MRKLDETTRAHIDAQIESEVARRMAPLGEALEKIQAQMLAHNAAVKAAQDAEAEARTAAQDEHVERSGWFRPEAPAMARSQPQPDITDQQAALTEQIQHLADQKLRARQAAVSKRQARIQHRLAARGAR